MIFVHTTRGDMNFATSSLIQLYYAEKRSNQARTRFVTLVHKIRGDMSFVKFFVHTVVISCKTVKSAKNTICDT